MAMVVGNNSDNMLEGTRDNDPLRGLGGDDLLQGFRGADRLEGGTGNDVPIDPQGNDTYLGGPGTDYSGFVYADGSNGRDVIRDFSLPDDFIIVSDEFGFDALDSSNDGELTNDDVGVTARGNRTTIDFGEIAGDTPGRAVLTVNATGGSRPLKEQDFDDFFSPAGVEFGAIA